MGFATLLAQQTYETLTPGDLDTQDGYAQLDAGADYWKVVAGSVMDGTNSVSYERVSGVVPAITEKAIGATRGSTDRWRIVFHVKVSSTSADGIYGITWTNGTADISGWTKDALEVNFRNNGGTVQMSIYDADYPRGQGVPKTVSGPFDLDTKAGVMVEISATDTYAVSVDDDADGEDWEIVATGSVVAANELISHFSFRNNGTGEDDKVWFDNLSHIKLIDDPRADLGSRPPRYAVLTGASEDEGTVTLTVSLYDALTGVLLEASRTRTMPSSDLEPTPDKAYQVRLDEALDAELRAYDREQRIATLANSGHGRTF